MTEVLTSSDLNAMLLNKSADVDEALTEYRERSTEWAEADRKARRFRAMCYTKLKLEFPKATGPLLDAMIDKDEEAEPILFRAVQAGVLRDTAKEALRARLAQLSAYQSLASTAREEMKLARG